jgi:hypothetical protein
MSLDVYTESERIVAALTDEQCDAVMAALERRVDRWELEHRGPSLTRQTLDLRSTSQVSLQRRRPGWLEAIRGVECCDPAVRDQWRVWRACFLVIGIIVMVAVSAGLVFGNVAVVVVLLAVFGACAAASHRITGGKASVCH